MNLHNKDRITANLYNVHIFQYIHIFTYERIFLIHISNISSEINLSFYINVLIGLIACQKAYFKIKERHYFDLHFYDFTSNVFIQSHIV